MAQQHSGQFGVVINVCYGEFYLSDKIKNLLSEKGVNNQEIHDMYSYENRSDHRLVEIISNLPEDERKSRGTNLVVEWFDEKYRGFIKINEYDGNESAVINIEAYERAQKDKLLRKIKEIIVLNTYDSIKVKLIQNLFL
jgi:hypothetical protein